jgi:hypothetical protein
LGLSKQSRIILIFGIIIILVGTGFGLLGYYLRPICTCMTEIVISDFKKKASNNELEITVSNLGGLDGRINTIDAITFTNLSTVYSPVEVYVNDTIIEFELMIQQGLEYEILLKIEDSFTNGSQYTLDIVYQARKSCDRGWNGYKIATLIFEY